MTPLWSPMDVFLSIIAQFNLVDKKIGRFDKSTNHMINEIFIIEYGKNLVFFKRNAIKENFIDISRYCFRRMIDYMV